MLVRWFDGRLSPDEIDSLASWIRESPENRARAQHIYDICFAAKMHSAGDRFNTENALAKVHAEMSARRGRNIMAVIRNVAAALLIPVVAAASIFFFKVANRPDNHQVQMIEVSTVTGMVSQFQLPDGSKVWMNANSTLRYPSVFDGATRDVELDGEAFFDVAHDKTHPFSVHTAQMDIQVTGTRFNVDAYNLPDRNPRAWLEEGGINLSWKNSSGEQQLVPVVPGQCAELGMETRTVSIASADIGGAAAWKDGGFSFMDTSLEEALRQIGNRFHVSFVIANKALMTRKYTGDLREETLSGILQNFSLADGIRFRTIEKSVSSGRQILEVY